MIGGFRSIFLCFCERFPFSQNSWISGSAVNGTRFVGSSHWKIPRKSGKSKKVVPFSRLQFPNGMSCSIYVSRSLYQFQVHGRAPPHVPGLTTKWNNFNFYQSEIPLLLPPKFRGFFRKWKAPCVSRFIASLFLVTVIMIDGSEKRNCEGGFGILEFACLWKAHRSK